MTAIAFIICFSVACSYLILPPGDLDA